MTFKSFSNEAETRETLQRVLDHALEENKAEIEKAFQHYLIYGRFYLKSHDDGTVEAVDPKDFEAVEEAITSAPGTLSPRPHGRS